MADAEQRRLLREALRTRKRAEALRANLKRRRAQARPGKTDPVQNEAKDSGITNHDAADGGPRSPATAPGDEAEGDG